MVFLSKSSLNTYIICPQLYKFIYVDKIETRVTSPQAQRGLDVHDFCFSFYDHFEGSGSGKFGLEQKWLEEQLLLASDEAKPYMQNFVEFEKKRWEICAEYYPEYPEKFFFPLLREQKILNKGLEINGIVDRVDLNFDENTFTVVDYKTEKFDKRPWKLTEHRREMAFYKMLIETSGLLRGEVTHFSICYPRSNDVWTEKFSWRTVNALRYKMQEVRNNIVAERFNCKVSFFCRFCQCNLICVMEY